VQSTLGSNALAEAFFASLECELIDRRIFQSHAEARMAVFRYSAEGVPIPVEGGLTVVPGVRMSQPACRIWAAGSCSSRWALSTQSWS